MKKFLFVSVLLVILSSCSHEKWLVKNIDYVRAKVCVNGDTIKTHIHDTIIRWQTETFIEPDFSSIDMVFECDSNNKVLLSKIDQLTGNRINMTYLLRDNKLTIQAKTDSITYLWNLVKEIKGIDSTIYVDRPVYVENEVKVTPWWDYVLFSVLGIVILGLIFKK
jgi:hypothetical protein